MDCVFSFFCCRNTKLFTAVAHSPATASTPFPVTASTPSPVTASTSSPVTPNITEFQAFPFSEEGYLLIKYVVEKGGEKTTIITAHEIEESKHSNELCINYKKGIPLKGDSILRYPISSMHRHSSKIPKVTSDFKDISVDIDKSEAKEEIEKKVNKILGAHKTHMNSKKDFPQEFYNNQLIPFLTGAIAYAALGCLFFGVT